MNYESLQVEHQGRVATVWMNRPEVSNAFNEGLIDELRAVCLELERNDAVRVVVLAGRGRNFSAGADLNWMRRAAAASFEDNQRDARGLAAMLRGWAELAKPSVARVQGAALGGGTGLAAACDICVAASDAVFATSEAKFGIIPATIGPYVLRAIGARQAHRYFQSAERISAQRALDIGLAHEVVEPDRLDAKVAEISAALIACGPQAQVAAKDLIRALDHRPISDDLVEQTAQRIARQRSTAEAREGFSAFLEKRPPDWIG